MSYVPRILTEWDDLQAVRHAAQMNVKTLPDSRILSNAYLPSTEAKVIKLIPGHATLGVDDTLLLRSAVTNLVAARAIRVAMEIEKSLEYEYKRTREKMAEALEKQAAEDLGDISVLASWVTPADILRVSGPTRTAKANETWLYETSVIR